MITKNNKDEKYILTVNGGPTQRLDGTTLTEKKKQHLINFTENNTKFSLNLHCKGANSYLYINGTKITKFKAKILKL